MPPRADVLRDGESRTGAVNINPRIVESKRNMAEAYGQSL